MLHFLGRRYREGYHMRELARRLHMGLGSASDSLRMLEKEGMVAKEKRGNLNIYRVNMEDPMLKELKVLFTILELREAVEDLKELSQKVILFGSRASGEDTEESDIDLFVLSEKRKLVSAAIDTNQKKVQRKLSAIIMGNEEYMNLKEKDKPLYERINGGRVVYEESIWGMQEKRKDSENRNRQGTHRKRVEGGRV